MSLANQFNKVKKKTIPPAATTQKTEDIEKNAPKVGTKPRDNDEFISILDRRKNHKPVEQTHKRQTFLVQKELIKEMNKLQNVYGYGFKIDFINEAVKLHLERIKSTG
jgi:hypothetical protein